MFIIEGLPASLWAIAWWALVQDRPSQASWLAPEERTAIETRIASEQGGIAPVRNYGEAFRSPIVIRMSVLYFFWGLSLFGFVLWLPTIIKQAGAANIVRDRLAVSRSVSARGDRDADRLRAVRSDAAIGATSCCRASP